MTTKALVVWDYPYSWNDGDSISFSSVEDATEWAKGMRTHRNGNPGTEKYCKITMYVVQEEVSF